MSARIFVIANAILNFLGGHATLYPPYIKYRCRVGKGAPATCPPGKLRIAFVTFFLILAPLSTSAQPKQIIFWHSMSGQLGLEVNKLASQFNQSQANYEIMPIYKGDYIESLTSFAAAFRAKQPPNIIQVFEVGSSVMRFPQGIVKPVDVLMHEQDVSIPSEHFLSAVRTTYSENGHLLAFPFNVSIPVLFYNADVLAQFGVTSDTFPQTWDAFEVLVKRLHDAGFPCAYTTAYPSWILIESYAATHGLTDIYTNAHMIAHIKRMRRWQKQHYFDYGGHMDDPTVLFTSKICPVFSQSSGAYAGLSDLVSFHLGVAPMPLDSHASTVRYNNVIGGGAIWVVAGQTSEMERGIALFFAFLAEPKRQHAWYENTGYLPLVNQARPPATGHYSSILDIAEFDLNNKIEPPHALQWGPQNQIRAINDQMLESIFAGMMPTEKAMAKTKIRVEHVRHRFSHNTRN